MNLFIVALLVVIGVVTGFNIQPRVIRIKADLSMMKRTNEEPMSYSKSAINNIALKTPIIGAGLAAASVILQPLTAARAEEAAIPAAPATPAAPAKVELGPVPTDFGLNYKDYYADVAKVVNHMRYAVQMEKEILELQRWLAT